jgi:hypothetical protein
LFNPAGRGPGAGERGVCRGARGRLAGDLRNASAHSGHREAERGAPTGAMAANIV